MRKVHLGTIIQTVIGWQDEDGNVVAECPLKPIRVGVLSEEAFGNVARDLRAFRDTLPDEPPQEMTDAGIN